MALLRLAPNKSDHHQNKGRHAHRDVGRTLGEMWHKLTDTEKEDYRTRAKDLTEKKLKAWQEQVLL